MVNPFRRPKSPTPQFVSALFLCLVVVFIAVLHSRPQVGLAGLGTVLILAAALVEFNGQLIWQNYKKSYKKVKGWRGRLTEPSRLYYRINTLILWPAVALLGAFCLYLAYVYTA